MIKSSFYIGIVEDRGDPDELGRVRVRIQGYHTDNLTQLPTQDLPWATVVQPAISSAFSGVGFTPKIVEGSRVLVIFADGDDNMQYPIVIGTLATYTPAFYKVMDNTEVARDSKKGFNDPNGQYPTPLYTDASSLPRLARNDTMVEFNRPTLESYMFNEPPSGIGGNTYPFNQVRQSESGHFEEWDDTPSNERLNLQHRAGTYREINPSGDRVLKVVADNYEITIKDNNIFIGGASRKIVQDSENAFINGNLTVTVGGNTLVNAIGDVSVVTNGNLNVKASKNMTLEAVGNFKIAAGGEIDIGSTGRTNIVSGGLLRAASRGEFLIDSASNLTMEAAMVDISPSGGAASVQEPEAPKDSEIPRPPLVQTIERPLLPSELQYINQLRDQFVYDSELRVLGVNYPPPPPAVMDGQTMSPQMNIAPSMGLGMGGAWSSLNQFLSMQFENANKGMWRETGSNPQIISCYKEVGFNIKTDAVPWCAAFAGYALKSSGFSYIAAPKSGLSSLAYMNYGTSVGMDPENWRKWDIIVFTRKGGGHIGFIYGVNRNTNQVIVFGGNQSDNLKLSSFPIRGDRFPISYVGRAWSPPGDKIFTTMSAGAVTSVV